MKHPVSKFISTLTITWSCVVHINTYISYIYDKDYNTMGSNDYN